MSIGSWIKRKYVYLYSKMVKENASPEYVARGWAVGMFFGCLIPIGFQLLFSIPFSFIMKGSKIGGALGTLLTNHVTIFFIYPIQCYVGSKILRLGWSFQHFEEKIEIFREAEGFWSKFIGLGGEFVASFFVGGFLLALITTPITYFLVLYTVRRYQKLKELRKQRRAIKLQRRAEKLAQKNENAEVK